METFELWAHRGQSELYAVRRTAGRVTGICGPIPADMVGVLDLSGCRYQDPQRFEGRGHEFLPAERWALGFENRAVILGALARSGRATPDRPARRPPPPALEAGRSK